MTEKQKRKRKEVVKRKFLKMKLNNEYKNKGK